MEAFLIESLRQVADQIRSAKLSKRPQCMPSHSHPGLLNETRTSLPLITSALGPSSSWLVGNGSPLRCRSNTSPTKCVSQGPKRTVEVVRGEKHVPIFQSLEDVPVKTAPKLDISQLTWEERERVLRYLFQKIHSSNQLSQHCSDVATRRHAGYDLLYESANDDARAFS